MLPIFSLILLASSMTETMPSSAPTHEEATQQRTDQPMTALQTSNTAAHRRAVLTASYSSSSSDDEISVTRSPQLASFIGATDRNDSDLDRVRSQIHGGLSQDERAELRQIASLHRSKTTASRPGVNRTETLAGVTDDDPRTDPDKPEFDIYIWARAFIKAQDEGGIKATRPGFTFKALSVSGSGAALSLQADVTSVFMAPFRLNEIFSIGHKAPRKILRDFNGVVKSGEMLVVLGRPGSGCSTLLKTICGELSGLEMDRGSVLHYDGASPDPRPFANAIALAAKK